ncbi:hypothetical protein [Dietzia sp. B44]|uniref:hypothetical protein n=1 Tax=Dietzia sp. B44 TaxID=1630633 RepID=UPI0015F9A672|nr:hypothetical protein [Dietzia sp. B44]MBB1052834.1 hypothetical protein [Dietzia sp. B44]
MPVSQIVDRNTVVDGHRISFGVHGEGDPVVLLHGTPIPRRPPGLTGPGALGVLLYILLESRARAAGRPPAR